LSAEDNERVRTIVILVGFSRSITIFTKGTETLGALLTKILITAAATADDDDDDDDDEGLLPSSTGGAAVRRRTRDRKVAGSTPGRGAIKSTRSTTQSSIPPG